MNKTYALIRVSTDKQDFDSQLQGITDYCRKEGLELLPNHIVKEYSVSGYKTTYENREGLKTIERLAEQQLIDTLIIFNLDRIGRRTDLLPFITKMTLANVRILSVTEGLINKGDEVAELMTFIKLWSNQGESKKTSARVKSGKLKTAKDGLWNGGKINLGYKVVDGRLVIDEDVAPIIRKAYHIYVIEGTSATIEYLKEYGIDKNAQTLNQMLRNPIYMGVYPYNKDLYSEEDYKELTKPNQEIQIISPELFAKTRAVAESRRCSIGKNATGLNRSDCVYEGLLEHGCGCNLTIDYDNRGSQRKRLFRCRHCRKYKKDEYKKSYMGHLLEPILDQKIRELFMELNKDKLKQMYLDNKGEKLFLLQKRLDNINEEINTQKTLLDKSNAKLQLLMSQDVGVGAITIVTDMITDIRKRLNHLEVEQSDVSIAITFEENEREQSSIIIDRFTKMKELYDVADYKKKRAILKLIIEKIIVRDYDDIEIFLKF